jgi:hypothetical protein
MTLRSTADQMAYEHSLWGDPFPDPDAWMRLIVPVETFALAVGDLCRVQLVDVHHLGPLRIAV